MQKKILHIIGRLGVGGDSSAVFTVMDSIDRDRYHFDFLTHKGYNAEKVEDLQNFGHKVFILEGDVRVLGPFKYYKEIKKILSSNHYDAVHLHTSLQSGIALLAAKHCNVGIRICHAHTNNIQRPVGFFKRKLYTPILKFIIKYSATTFVACGKEAGNFLFSDSNKYVVLNNGINLEKFVYEKNELNLKEELDIPINAVLLGHIGRFSTMKNQKFVIDILKRLHEKGIVSYIIFVGDGEEYENVKKYAVKMGVIDFCRFVGRSKSVEKYLSIIDVITFPSLEGEGFPITLVEAQAANCQCIVSTNVTQECDLGLGLVNFLSLEDINIWCDKVIELIDAPHPDQDVVYKLLKDLNFDQKESSNMWRKLYNINIRSNKI